MSASIQKLSQKAFTLIELLVVIAITSVLLSLLMPALAQAKKKARQVACVSNLRQIGFAMAIYTQEHEERFPDRRDLKRSLPGGYRPWETWPKSDPRSGWAAGILEPNLHGFDVWICPGLRASPLAKAVQSNQPVSNATNAPVANYWMWRFDQIGTIPLDNFWGKTEIQAISDLRDAKNPTVGNLNGPVDVEMAVDPYFPQTMADLPDEIRGRAVHQGGRNRLFMDGHVQFLRDPRTR